MTSNIADKPLVSVWMIAYNHEKFITEAIESILMQDVDFDYEIVVGEDNSTDSTAAILSKYEEQYPGKFRVRNNKVNMGISPNMIMTLNECEGTYVALLEGDDYWVEKNKLQKQVDFLENNQDFSMACNSSSEVYEDGTEFKIAKREESIIDLGMVLREGWFIRTASIVFRREAIKKGFPDFFYTAYSTDYILQIMILKYGKCKYFPEVMSAYRHHAGGISQANKPLQLDRWITKIKLLDTLNRYTNEEYDYEIKEHQKGIKQTISFYLFRYPRLLKAMGHNFYLKHANPYLFFKEIMKRKLG